MNEQVKKIVEQVGTDVSGRWISVNDAEKFARLVIQAYTEELRESRREVKTELGYSRVGLNNV